MPTGRPDYWYGTALYFDDSPGDGEVTRGPTANWAYDHVNNAEAHHAAVGGGDIDHGDITNVTAAQHHTKYTDADALVAVRAIVDDTPVDAATTEPISSNWAFDHKADVDAHHAKYTDAAALAAVRAIVDDTAVDGATTEPISSNWAFDHKAAVAAHHAKYTDANAVTAMGAKADSNALNHDIYDVGKSASVHLGYYVVAAGLRAYYIYSEGDQVAMANLHRLSGANGVLKLMNLGTGGIQFVINGSPTLFLKSGGGCTGLGGFVDRGDPASADFTQATLTEDATWRNLDLSSIIPTEAVSVLLKVQIQHPSGVGYIMFREDGNSNTPNASLVMATVASVLAAQDVVCVVGAARTIEYYATASPTLIYITVGGWWV